MQTSKRIMRGWTWPAAVLVAAVTLLGMAAPDPTSAKKGPVDVNQATAEQLQAVPGIGPVLAKRIVAFRKEHGPFRKLDDLLKVRGIGEKSLDKLKPYLTVSPSSGRR